MEGVVLGNQQQTPPVGAAVLALPGLTLLYQTEEQVA
jgi:hypothetical protein